MDCSQSAITPENLTKASLDAWRLALRRLPADHGSRWSVNRTVQPHGSRRSVLLWRIWDSRCSRFGLSNPYFCWCLNFDPEHFYNRNTHWQFHLYINTIRLYRHASTLRTLLPRRLREVCPAGFKPVNDDHSTQLIWNFDPTNALRDLPTLLSPVIERALQSTAPVFDEIFSLLGRSDLPTARPCPRPAARPVANPAVESHGGILSRSIRPALRRLILQRHGHRCWICGKGFQPGDPVHIDHTLPWSKGGLTEPENLRPAHAFCNLQKGGRITGDTNG